MAEPRYRPDWPDDFWASISRDDTIRCLFPDLQKSSVDFSTMLPGRNWKLGDLPPEPSAFDNAVKDLLNDNYYRRIINKQNLIDKGFICPYYAWRIHAVLAAENANACYHNLSKSSRNKIIGEIEYWSNRVKASKSIEFYKSDIIPSLGSVYLQERDFDDGASRELQLSRALRLEEIRNEITRDEEIITGLQDHLARMDRILLSEPGRAPPDPWQMPFFVFMSAFWRDMTGEEAPVRDGPFQKILTEASRCISNDKYAIREWGQYRTANKKMEKFSSNEGKRIGNTGFFTLEEEKTFGARGPEMLRFLAICSDEDVSISDLTIISSVIFMRDTADGDLALLVRDVLLRNLIAEIGVTGERTFIQLGWPAKTEARILEAVISRCVQAANNGDIAAAAVIEALYTFDERAHKFIKNIKHNGWTLHFAGFKKSDLEKEFEKLSVMYPTWPQMTGDFRAFEVAMEILDKCYEAEETSQITYTLHSS